MKVIILAAGKGTRLGCPTEPKPLTTLDNGKCILSMQVDALSRVIEYNNIYVVVGYLKEKIIEKFPNLNFIINSNFENENTSKSLLKALNALHENDDDILWINGDVVFHQSILSPLIKKSRSAMVVNRAVVGEEEVKYLANKNGQILEVSKQIHNGDGEALGINFFVKEDIPTLKQNLTDCKASDYFEKAIELSIQQGTRVYCEYIESGECIEIDFPEDVDKANTLIKNWALQ